MTPHESRSGKPFRYDGPIRPGMRFRYNDASGRERIAEVVSVYRDRQDSDRGTVILQVDTASASWSIRYFRDRVRRI